MARFIAMRILPYHTGTENRKLLIIGRAVREHTVKLLRKALLPAGQGYQSVNILLHRPEILPTVAFANMRRIIIRRETVYKSSPVITRLHERCLRIIYILIILRTFVEFIRYLPLTQLLGQAGYTVIIVSILQGFGERPVLCIIAIRHVVRHISMLLIKADAPIIIHIGCGHASLQSLLSIKIPYTFQTGIHNDRYGVIAYHHIRFAAIKIPYRQATVLLIKGKEGFHHVVHTRRLYISIKRMRGTVRIP